MDICLCSPYHPIDEVCIIQTYQIIKYNGKLISPLLLKEWKLFFLLEDLQAAVVYTFKWGRGICLFIVVLPTFSQLPIPFFFLMGSNGVTKKMLWTNMLSCLAIAEKIYFSHCASVHLPTILNLWRKKISSLGQLHLTKLLQEILEPEIYQHSPLKVAGCHTWQHVENWLAVFKLVYTINAHLISYPGQALIILWTFKFFCTI